MNYDSVMKLHAALQSLETVAAAAGAKSKAGIAARVGVADLLELAPELVQHSELLARYEAAAPPLALADWMRLAYVYGPTRALRALAEGGELCCVDGRAATRMPNGRLYLGSSVFGYGR